MSILWSAVSKYVLWCAIGRGRVAVAAVYRANCSLSIRQRCAKAARRKQAFARLENEARKQNEDSVGKNRGTLRGVEKNSDQVAPPVTSRDRPKPTAVAAVRVVVRVVVAVARSPCATATPIGDARRSRPISLTFVRWNTLLLTFARYEYLKTLKLYAIAFNRHTADNRQ